MILHTHKFLTMLKVNLRLRMFLCSSSSAVGLWLNRLKKIPRSILRNVFLEYLCVFNVESSPGRHLHRQPECRSCQVINQLVFVQETTEGSWRKTMAKTPFLSSSFLRSVSKCVLAVHRELKKTLLPCELGGCLLSGLESLLIRLQWQDVLVLQFPLWWAVTQLDGQRIFPQNLHGQCTFSHQMIPTCQLLLVLPQKQPGALLPPGGNFGDECILFLCSNWLIGVPLKAEEQIQMCLELSSCFYKQLLQVPLFSLKLNEIHECWIWCKQQSKWCQTAERNWEYQPKK